MMLYMGRLAREAAGALALAPTEPRTARSAMAARIEANAQKIIDTNVQDLEVARQGSRQGFPRPIDARSCARRSDGQRPARGRGARRSGRASDGVVDKAERLYFACACRSA
jgi:hypothetical protein